MPYHVRELPSKNPESESWSPTPGRAIRGVGIGVGGGLLCQTTLQRTRTCHQAGTWEFKLFGRFLVFARLGASRLVQIPETVDFAASAYLLTVQGSGSVCNATDTVAGFALSPGPLPLSIA